MLKELKITGQDGVRTRSGLHASAHAKLKTHMGHITHLEHDIVRFQSYS